MRLGQLSRKLGLTPSEIHRFLSDKGQAVEAGLNTRLTDDQVLIAVRHFDPSQESAILREDSDAGTVEENAPVETVPEVRQGQENEEIENVATAGDIQSETPAEVIRAPKQELPGLKVVGKIELKDPKKKEAEQETAADSQPATSEPGGGRERQARPPRRERPEQRTWKNPLEVQRQREAHEREEKLKRERELEKERRTQQYLKKVKSTPTKPVRKQEETVVETQVETKPAPKTWLGKIARWLTS